MNSKPLKVIKIFFIATLVGTIALWILDVIGVKKNVLLSGFTPPQYYGFLAADVFAMSLLLISIIGLQKMKFWGLIATQIEMGTWIYSSVGSLIMAILSGSNDVFVLIWTPLYIIFSCYVIYYTYKIRGEFT